MSGVKNRLEEAIQLKIEGRYEEAVPILLDILGEADGEPEAHRQIGLIYGFQGFFDESLEELIRAVELAPKNADILCDLAMTYAMLGMFEEAKAGFKRVLELDPENKVAKQQIVYFMDDMAIAG